MVKPAALTVAIVLGEWLPSCCELDFACLATHRKSDQGQVQCVGVIQPIWRTASTAALVYNFFSRHPACAYKNRDTA